MKKKDLRSSGNPRLALRPLAAAVISLNAGVFATAAGAQGTGAALNAAPIVVTATRIEQSSFDLPVSIDALTQEQIQAQKAGVNIGEVLARVPGTVIQNRETYSQEQQVVIRGFGARSQFGVRGIKLIADGIPASTPDGQGGTGLFDLSSARSIEVLRGPFSALYGNHSGGVVQIFTEDGPDRPTLTGNFSAGSYGTAKAGVKFGGQQGNINYNASASRFETDGYRQWSEARKDQFNAKLRVAVDAKSAWTLVANYLDQPENLDPLGLTAAQLATDRRAASQAALDFKTRRSLDNQQGGLVYEGAVSDVDTIRVMGYVGSRSNEQFLAIPLVTQNNLRHSGGLSTFDRSFAGGGLRWTRKMPSVTFTAGADYERAEDGRKGFLNANGSAGALKRDEDNTVWQGGAYAQAEWQLTSEWSLSGGLRYTKVAFDSKDKFICTTIGGTCSGSTTTVSAANFNPDDSGSTSYDAWTPAVGLLYHLTPTVNLYANAGRSFEAPTFIELAYKPDGTSGLNFDLKPSKSNHFEVGMKAFIGAEARLNLAVFRIDTGNEMVTFSNSGGRATFQNAGDTRRRGLEIALDGNLGGGFAGYLSATYLDARFQDGFRACAGIPCTTPNTTVDAGKRIPGVPVYTAYGELSWRYPALGFTTAAEARWSAKVYANDSNTVSADSYAVANVRAGFQQQVGNWRLSEFARVDNLFDEKYVGAVYVNDGNSRFFAPAPERSYLVGVSANYRY